MKMQIHTVMLTIALCAGIARADVTLQSGSDGELSKPRNRDLSHPGAAPRGVLPGDDCSSAIFIPGLPFEEIGSTCDFSDSGDAACPDPSKGAPDIVYQFTPLTDDVISISLCNPCTDYDTKLYVLDNCPGTMPIACNDDACSTLGFPDADVVSEITGMPVTAGVLYFIYVDGNGLDCGTYHLTIIGQTPGACCLQDGTCEEGLPPDQCVGLGEVHHAGQTCADLIACPKFEPDTCTAEGVFGPGLSESAGGITEANIADVFGGNVTQVFEGFWNVSSPITQISWWGVFLSWDGIQFTGPCFPNDAKTQFEIVFYDDNDGAPGLPIAPPMVVLAEVIDTGIPFALGENVNQCVADLPMPLVASEGWISITALDEPSMPDCLHLWVNNAEPDAGDGFAWQFLPGGDQERLPHDMSLCLGGMPCGSCPGDVNGDGAFDARDVQGMVECVLAGPDVQPGCECADIDFDLTVDLNDAGMMVDGLIEALFGLGECAPLLAVQINDGAEADDTSGADHSAAARAYDGVPVTFQITSLSPPAALTGLTLVAKTQNDITLLTEPLAFVGGQSQVMSLAAPTFGNVIHLFVEGAGVPADTTIYRFLVEAGPVATVQAFEVGDFLEALGDPFNTLPGAVTFVGEPGECGSAGPLNITSPPNDPDDPYSGAIDTSDFYVIRLFDSVGRPCRGQRVDFVADDPTVIGLTSIADEEGQQVQFRVETETDDEGFAHALVVYNSAGSSGVTVEPKVGAVTPIPAPNTRGGTAVFTSSSTTNSVIRSVSVTKIKDTDNEVNEGVRNGGGILVYGTTYCFEVKTRRRLRRKEKIIWCVNGQPVNDAKGERIEGRVAYITLNDPDADAANNAEVKVTAKIVVVDGDGTETVKSEEKLVSTVTEKKTIALCVKQFARNNKHPSKEEWEAELKRINMVYNGTGVCFSLDADNDITNIDTRDKSVKAKAKKVGSEVKAFLKGKLVDCVCEDESLQGSKSKITIYTGVNGYTYENGESKSLAGLAMGANEVVEEAGQTADYDICGKWANTLAVKRNKVNSRRATVAHEIGHILGCQHHNSDTNNLMCKGKTRKTKATKVTPDQAKTIYKTACKIKDEDC